MNQKKSFRCIDFAGLIFLTVAVMGVAPISCQNKQPESNAVTTPPTPAANLGLSVDSTPVSNWTYQFSAISHGSSEDVTFTLSNSGNATAQSLGTTGSGPSTPFSFKDGTFPGTGGTCGSSLDAGSSCAIVMTFAPSSIGSFNSSAALAYADNSGEKTETLNLSGTGSVACTPIVGNNSTSYHAGMGLYDGLMYASTFSFSSAQQVQQIGVSLVVNAPVSTGSVQVSIETDASGAPSGTTVGSAVLGSIAMSTVPVVSSVPNGDNVNSYVTLSSPLSVPAGNYWLVVSTTGVDSSANLQIVTEGFFDSGSVLDFSSTGGGLGQWSSQGSGWGYLYDVSSCD